MSVKKEVRFETKSSWQKTDCINNSAENTCDNPSTLEAVFGEGAMTKRVRCCTEPVCKERAATLARL